MRIFASHDWGAGGANHERVRRVVHFLRERGGMDVWFDETHMKGNILDAMCKGISESDVILVFVTCNYVRKVQHGDDTDNVRREFMYAKDYPAKLLAVRFDGALPSIWPGPVGMVLGSHLYTDLTLIGERTLNALLATLRARKPLPPATPARSKGGGTMRARVNIALGVAGEEALCDDVHMGAALDRLVATLCGTQAGLPFARKLSLVERELGIV